MSKTYKDKPEKYRDTKDPYKKGKPKEGRRFESSKGRKAFNKASLNTLEDTE